MEELILCDNINPFKDWLVSIMTDACSLADFIDGDILDVIDEKDNRIQQMKIYNQDLENQNQVLREQIEKVQRVTPDSSRHSTPNRPFEQNLE